MVPPASVVQAPQPTQAAGPFSPYAGYALNPQSVMGQMQAHFGAHFNNPYHAAFQQQQVLQQQQQQGWIGSAHTSPTAKSAQDALHRAAAMTQHQYKLVHQGPLHQTGGVVLEHQRPLSEKETKELKRKKANRESARRSKLRKKEEFESLARRVDELITKGLSLRTEIAKMEGKLETLTAQNQTLRKEVLAARGNLDCLAPLAKEPKAKVSCHDDHDEEDDIIREQTSGATESDCTNEIHRAKGGEGKDDVHRNDSGGESDDANCTVRI